MQSWQSYGNQQYPPYAYQPAVAVPQYASFWRRLVALILDDIIAGLGAVILLVILDAITGLHLYERDASGDNFSISFGGWPYALLITAYFVLLNGRGATLGKKALGLRVTEREGGAPGLAKGGIRGIIPALGLALDPLLSLAADIANDIGGWDAAFATGASAIGIILGYAVFQMVDGLSMIGDEHKQTIHDKMAGTYVIRG